MLPAPFFHMTSITTPDRSNLDPSTADTEQIRPIKIEIVLRVSRRRPELLPYLRPTAAHLCQCYACHVEWAKIRRDTYYGSVSLHPGDGSDDSDGTSAQSSEVMYPSGQESDMESMSELRVDPTRDAETEVDDPIEDSDGSTLELGRVPVEGHEKGSSKGKVRGKGKGKGAGKGNVKAKAKSKAKAATRTLREGNGKGRGKGKGRGRGKGQGAGKGGDANVA